MSLKIGSLNCTGVRTPKKQLFLSQVWQSFGLDLLVVQETYFTDMKGVRRFRRRFDRVSNYWSFSVGRSGGVGILLSPKITVQQFVTDPSGSVVLLDIVKDQKTLRVVGIYAPTRPGPRSDFFQNLGLTSVLTEILSS